MNNIIEENVENLEEKLRELYINQGLSQRKIAKILNLAPATVHYHIHRYNIVRENLYPELTKEKLYEDYIVNKMPVNKIAEKYGIKSMNTVCQRLIKYDIKRIGLRAEKTINIKKQDLERLYIQYEWSLSEIAEYFNLKNRSTIKRLLKQHNIHRDFKTGKRHVKACKNKGTGYKGIWGRYWRDIQAGAKERQLDFNISIEYAWSIYKKQNMRCAITGVKIFFRKVTEKSSTQTCSLDRINSNIGYIKGNIQWVHKDINQIKFDFPLEKLKYWAKLIVNFKNRKPKRYET